MNLIDCHTHSTNSPDAVNAPEAMVLTAMDMGLSAYALTDHCEINRWFPYEHYTEHFNPEDTYDFASSFENAMADNLRLKEKYKGKLNFVNGIELGQAQFDFGLASAVASDARLDFIIGSCHQVRGYDDFAFTDYTKTSPQKLVDQYYKEIYEICQWGRFDVLGHLTYPLRYIEGNHGLKVDMSGNDEIIAESFKLLIQNGKGIEINTSGYRQKYGKPFPDIYYVKMFRDLGGEFISIGSDAHCTEDLGKGIREGAELAMAAGFDKLTYFVGRKPHQIKL